MKVIFCVVCGQHEARFIHEGQSIGAKGETAIQAIDNCLRNAGLLNLQVVSFSR